MSVARLVDFLGVPSLAKAGTLDLQNLALKLGSATGEAVHHGMIEVKQAAAVYGPTAADQAVELLGNVCLLPSQIITPPSVVAKYAKRWN